jgi:hypothetical protein
MEKFQDLLESILIQVELSVPTPDSTDNKDSSQEGRQCEKERQEKSNSVPKEKNTTPCTMPPIRPVEVS